MDSAHQLLAIVAGVAAGIGAAWALVELIARRSFGAAFLGIQTAVFAVLLLGAVTGLFLLLAGSRPADWMHLLYAGIAVAVIPVTRSLVLEVTERRRPVVLLVAFLALGGLILRLFGTA